MWIIAINGEDIITDQDPLDELQHHHNQRGKYKVKISIFRSKSYQRTDIEYIRLIFDQVITVFSNIEVSLTDKLVSQRKLSPQGTLMKIYRVLRDNSVKEDLFVKCDN